MSNKQSKGWIKAISLRDAAELIVHQRDTYAEQGVYDTSKEHPGEDQAFDDWAADLCEHALAFDNLLTR